MLFSRVTVVAAMLAARVSSELSGSATISYHDYQQFPLSVIANNPPSCGMSYAELDLTRITALQAMSKETDCGQCIKVCSVEDPSKFVHVLAVDTGGTGLDLSKPSFAKLFDLDVGRAPAQWSPAPSSMCAGIWNKGGQPETPVDPVEPPVVTVEPPVVTVEPPVVTVEPPVETPVVPVVTVEPPVETPVVPVVTVEPPVTSTPPAIPTPSPVHPPTAPATPPSLPPAPPASPAKPTLSKPEYPAEPIPEEQANSTTNNVSPPATGLGGLISLRTDSTTSHAVGHAHDSEETDSDTTDETEDTADGSIVNKPSLLTLTTVLAMFLLSMLG